MPSPGPQIEITYELEDDDLSCVYTLTVATPSQCDPRHLERIVHAALYNYLGPQKYTRVRNVRHKAVALFAPI